MIMEHLKKLITRMVDDNFKSFATAESMMYLDSLGGYKEK